MIEQGEYAGTTVKVNSMIVEKMQEEPIEMLRPEGEKGPVGEPPLDIEGIRLPEDLEMPDESVEDMPPQFVEGIRLPGMEGPSPRPDKEGGPSPRPVKEMKPVGGDPTDSKIPQDIDMLPFKESDKKTLEVIDSVLTEMEDRTRPLDDKKEGLEVPESVVGGGGDDVYYGYSE